jgi:sterol desaturase/sphingolipid hydroxylase (fatty acid hydroxylase superfamily)
MVGIAQAPLTVRRRPLSADWLVAVVVAAAGVWLMIEGFRALSGERDLPGALKSAEGILVGPALFAVVLVLFLAERRWPAVPRPVRTRAHAVDAGYLALLVVIGPLVTLLSTGFAVTVDRYARFLILGRLPLVPELLVVIVILIAMDGMNWVAHVANHRSEALWRFHALHHSQEDMSVFTTFRTHPLSHVSYLPSLLPALVLGASGVVPGMAIVVYGAFVTLPHANLRWTFGPLRGVLVSPAFHRLHHANEPVAGHQAVNFGFVLVIWDRLAGCAVQPAAGPPTATGLSGRPVPVEQAAPPGGLPRVVVSQLVDPLRRSGGSRGPGSE